MPTHSCRNQTVCALSVRVRLIVAALYAAVYTVKPQRSIHNPIRYVYSYSVSCGNTTPPVVIHSDGPVVWKRLKALPFDSHKTAHAHRVNNKVSAPLVAIIKRV
jgi:hypothetical protein